MTTDWSRGNGGLLATAFVLAASGVVGIGSSAPADALDVNAQAPSCARPAWSELQGPPTVASGAPDKISSDIAFREVFGLEANRSYVENLYRQKQSGGLDGLSETRGVLLTIAEQAELDLQRDYLRRAAVILKERPEIDAGVHLDEELRRVVVHVTSGGDAVNSLLRGAGIPDNRLTVVEVAFTQRELREVQDRVMSARPALLEAGVRLSSTASNVESNCVVIRVSPDSVVTAEAVIARYVPPGRFIVLREELPVATGVSGRTAPPLRGGAQENSSTQGGSCTSGFIGYADVNGVRKFYMMWAAHCTYVGDRVTQDGYALGTVDKREWRVGQTVVADAARVPILPGLATNDVMLNRATDIRNIVSVEGVGADSDDDFVCGSGITTGYVCGSIDERSFDYCLDDAVSTEDVCFIYGRVATFKAALGDSGGPVFDGVQAMGIISARRLDGTSRVVYSHIYDVTRSMGIRVVTY